MGIKTKYKLGQVTKEEFINNYNQLQSQQKMAEFYNVDRHTIGDFAKRFGIDESVYKRRYLTDQETEMIIDNYHNKSAQALSNELQATRSAIAGVWHRNGLTGKVNRIYYVNNEHYFETIDSQDKAYFLGFIGADGCIYKSKNADKQNILRISIQQQDVKILKLFQSYLDTNKPIGEYTNNKNTYVYLEISSDIICDDIEKVGLSNRKTYDNTIAMVDDKFMPALIRGYFDGDGSIGKHKKVLDASVSVVGYETNMKKIMDYLHRKNIYSAIVYDQRKYTISNDGSKFCSLVLSNKTSKYCFLKLIYENANNVYIDRKYNRACEYINAIESSDYARDKQIVNYYEYAVKRAS